MGKNKDILVSRSNFENNSMEHVLLSDSTKLQTNKYGIPEPIGGITVNPEQIDVVFVPLWPMIYLATDWAMERVL